jgi:hypothetical protein
MLFYGNFISFKNSLKRLVIVNFWRISFFFVEFYYAGSEFWPPPRAAAFSSCSAKLAEMVGLELVEEDGDGSSSIDNDYS